MMSSFFLNNGTFDILHVIRMGRIHLGKTQDQRPGLLCDITMYAYEPDGTVA